MTKRTVYRYTGENGVVISPVKLPNAQGVEMVRLLADTGKVLTDGTQQTTCIDVLPSEVSKWVEIDAPPAETE
jgi:hypothetical protein